MSIKGHILLSQQESLAKSDCTILGITQDKDGGIVCGVAKTETIQGVVSTMVHINNISYYNNIIMNPSKNPTLFHELKTACSFIPIRFKAQKFMKKCIGLLDINERNDLVNNKRDAIFYRYTSEENWFCTRLNLSLAIDLEEFINQECQYIRYLKCCIGWQSKEQPIKPKYVYRGAYMNAIEAISFQIKDTFYIPNFVSTSTVKESAFRGNVIMRIDISNYHAFAALINPNQSKYDEKECLLSCYNVYRFKGFYDSGNRLVIDLETLNESTMVDRKNSPNHAIIGASHGNLPVNLLKGASNEIGDRSINSDGIISQILKLQKNFKLLKIETQPLQEIRTIIL
jgi:hypothetical protein